MIFEEFKHLKHIEDKNNPFSNLYQLDGGELLYVEGGFHTQLMGFKEQFPHDFPRIISHIEEVTKKNKRVVLTCNFESPQTNAEGFIYLEITDITDPLKIFAEDKSRGSDYGD